MPSQPVREGLFEDGHLIGGRCGACTRICFPRAPTCPYCGSDDVAEVELSSSGTLWGWTAVTSAPPGYRGEVPFGFGVVELPEGIRVVTRLTYPVDRHEFGMPMRLVLVPLHESDDGDAVVTYEFTGELTGEMS
jgi:uncharacterized OB-fold protein